MKRFFKRLFCRHDYQWDMTRPVIVRTFSLFNPCEYEETIIPVQCPKCGKLSKISNIV